MNFKNFYERLSDIHFDKLDLNVRNQRRINVKKYFDIPTKDKQKKLMIDTIISSSNIELEKLYKEVNYNIKYCPSKSLIPEFKEEKKLIVEEMQNRNIKKFTFSDSLLIWIKNYAIRRPISRNLKN